MRGAWALRLAAEVPTGKTLYRRVADVHRDLAERVRARAGPPQSATGVAVGGAASGQQVSAVGKGPSAPIADSRSHTCSVKKAEEQSPKRKAREQDPNRKALMKALDQNPWRRVRLWRAALRKAGEQDPRRKARG